MGFILLASLLYLERFTASPATWIWFSTLAIGVLAFGAALVWRPLPRQLAGSQLASMH